MEGMGSWKEGGSQRPRSGSQEESRAVKDRKVRGPAKGKKGVTYHGTYACLL